MCAHVPELLAPAGGPAEFNAALAAGADAIYCGFGNTFNARRGAKSFTSQTFGEACRRAHLAGARVYVTVNVVIRDDEMAPVLALIRRAWLLGADAFIIQDWGLLREVCTRWPEIDCHVSTQANVHDARGAKWCTELGASRVTLSRELSLQEIAKIAQAGVEVESFCHGAICICYSGVCQMSSSAGDRSANRGACAQPCRLPYKLVDEQGHALNDPGWGRPLCPKDFYSLDDLPALVGTGISSLKIEGRLKGPEYVASVLGAYRAALDDLLRGVTPSPKEEDKRRTQLKRVFNRDFTNAYLRGTSGNELMSYERSNNRGEVVGKVVDARSFGTVKVRRGSFKGGRERLRTVRVAEVDIELAKYVDKGDLLEVRPTSSPSQFLTTTATQDAAVGTTITCRTARPMEVGSVVRVIRSQAALSKGKRMAQTDIPRRREVLVCIRACLGEPFEVELRTVDGAARARAQGPVVGPAHTRAVTKEDLVEHVGRMGGTWFCPAHFDVKMDAGCGMGFSAVHEVRSCACEALERALLEPYNARSLEAAPSREALYGRLVPRTGEHAPEVCAVVTSPEAARAALDAGATRLYATTEHLREGTWPTGVVPVLDEVCREEDHARLDAWVQEGAPVAVGNVSELVLAVRRGALPEVRGCIPVHNALCLDVLTQAGAVAAWLSPELSLDEIRMLASYGAGPLGMVVLGRSRTMTCEHCVLQAADACMHDCARCKLRVRGLYLQNDAGSRFPVVTDLQGRSRVYAAQSVDLTPHIPKLAQAGVSRFAVDATLLDPAQTRKAVQRAMRAIDAWRRGRMPEARLAGHTSGHLFDPIA